MSMKFDMKTSNRALYALANACRGRKVDEDYHSLKGLIDAVIRPEFSGDINQISEELEKQNELWPVEKAGLRHQLSEVQGALTKFGYDLRDKAANEAKAHLLAERRAGEVEGLLQALNIVIAGKIDRQ